MSNIDIPMADLEDLRVWARAKMQRPPDFIIGDHDQPYMRRWWAVPRNRFQNVYLHEVLRSDDDRAGHDHPWDNRTLIIEGGYEEVLFDEASPWLEAARITRVAGDVVNRSATDTHRLIVPEGGHCISLFFTGPVVRDWGFWCPNGRGWVHWRDFVDDRDKGLIGAGCGEAAHHQTTLPVEDDEGEGLHDFTKGE